MKTKYDNDIQFETEQLLDYYVERLAECESLSEIYELNWYVKDRVSSLWRELFDTTIEMAKVKNDEESKD